MANLGDAFYKDSIIVYIGYTVIKDFKETKIRIWRLNETAWRIYIMTEKKGMRNWPLTVGRSWRTFDEALKFLEDKGYEIKTSV